MVNDLGPIQNFFLILFRKNIEQHRAQHTWGREAFLTILIEAGLPTIKMGLEMCNILAFWPAFETGLTTISNGAGPACKLQEELAPDLQSIPSFFLSTCKLSPAIVETDIEPVRQPKVVLRTVLKNQFPPRIVTRNLILGTVRPVLVLWDGLLKDFELWVELITNVKIFLGSARFLGVVSKGRLNIPMWIVPTLHCWWWILTKSHLCTASSTSKIRRGSNIL